jgi:H+/Cl- antiporter ClcA/CBS domain-containing protein
VVDPVSGRRSALPLAPSLAKHPFPGEDRASLVTPRVLFVSMLAVFVGLLASGVALLLTRLIGFVTNIAFYGQVSTSFTSPADSKLGVLVVVVPAIGGLIVGVMARWGSAAIRGHGIPEAMEQVLFNESRVAPRLTLLKPLSAAVAIGTGGPFGAEGPIIATGGALGSLLGQVLSVTAHERKALLAAGAAAGMAATFGTPVSAVILAVELLLFEYRAQSLIPVALASVAAAGCRGAATGFEPVFAMPHLGMIPPLSLPFYVGLGSVLGVFSVWITRAVYAVEDLFERLPIHWMWWPALGGVAVGVVGYVAPHTLGVGYDNIEHILAGQIAGRALVVLCVAKFASWVIALGSGTSGGTLAPLFTIGGALGGLLGAIAATAAPALGIDPRMAAVVGMAALFAGASHATLASVVFAYETTHEPATLLPLLGGCAAAYLVSCLLMRTSIMTEKIARRGIRVRSEYGVDHLEQLRVRGHCTTEVVALRGGQTLAETRSWLLSGMLGAAHSSFPVVADDGAVLGVVTRAALAGADPTDARPIQALASSEPPVVYEDMSLREAADMMALGGVDLLPVVPRLGTRVVLGVLTRTDLLKVACRRLAEGKVAPPTFRLRPRHA